MTWRVTFKDEKQKKGAKEVAEDILRMNPTGPEGPKMWGQNGSKATRGREMGDGKRSKGGKVASRGWIKRGGGVPPPNAFL